MKKISLIFIFLTILLTTSIVNAEGVGISLKSKDLIGYTGETTTTDITIQNTQSTSDEFSINIWPPYWAGINVNLEKSRVKISANSNETVKLYFSIPIDIDELIVPYNITVKSVRNETISTVQILNLRVIRTVPIYISNIKVEKYVVYPEENVRIESSISNTADDAYLGASLQTNIKKDDTMIQRFDDRLEVIPRRSEQKKEHVFAFGKYTEPGVYIVEVLLKDVINRVVSSKKTTIILKNVSNITYQKIISYGLLLQTITIKVKNEGNAPATSFYVTEDIPTFMKAFFYPSEQATVEVIGNRIYYHWLIQDLIPGGTRNIIYQISLWNAWAIAQILIIAVIIAFRIVYVPGVVKRFRHTGPISRGKEIQIALEVKNRSIHEIKDVTVRDFVPPIAKVVDRFDTVRPLVRRIGTGTEVIWKFDSLKPREERVLTYWIVPSVDIPGSLKLTKAYMRFVDRKKIKRISASKTVTIKSR